MLPQRIVLISLAFSACFINYTIARQVEQTALTGKVVDEKAHPIDGAKVTLHVIVYPTSDYPDPKDVSFEKEVMTEVDGTFSFSISSKSDCIRKGFIIAEKEGYALGFDDWEIREGSKELEIKLGQSKELEGMVVDRSGQPVSGAQVVISRLRIGEGQEQKQIAASIVRKLFTSTTDKTGKFVFNGLPADATAEFLIKKAGRGTINTDQRLGGKFRKGTFAPGQSGIKLVLPVEARIEGIAVEKQTGKLVPGIKLKIWEGLNKPTHEHFESEVDGTFSIGSLAQGHYVLDLLTQTEDLADWVADPIEVLVEEGKTESGIRMELSKGGVLEVVVTDTTSKQPVEKAQVAIVSVLSSQYHDSASDKDGIARIRLMPGDYQISSIYGQDYLRQEPRHFVTIEEGKTEHLEYELSKRPRITGIVRTDNDKPLEGISLIILPSGDNFTTDAQGKFELSYTPEKRNGQESPMYLICRDEERNLAAAVSFDVGTKELDIKLEPGITFTGKVTDPNGNGVAQARIVVMFWNRWWGSSIGYKRITADEQGNFEVRAIPAHDRYQISVTAEGYGEEHIGEVGTEDAVNNRLDVGTLILPVANLSVSGVVVDTNGEPVPGVALYAYEEKGQPERTTFTDENGRFTIGKVCAGSIQIMAGKRGAIPLDGFKSTKGGAKNVRIVVSQRPLATPSKSRIPSSIVGKSLPHLSELGIDLSLTDMDSRNVLLCFFDMNQRPSRNCVLELAKRAQEFKTKGVLLVAVQASRIEQEKLDEWIKKNKISLSVGMIRDNEEKTRLNWGVKSLPWLILTDGKQLVRAEGFGLDNLDSMTKEQKNEEL